LPIVSQLTHYKTIACLDFNQTVSASTASQKRPFVELFAKPDIDTLAAEVSFVPLCGHPSRVKCCDLNRRPLCGLRLQHPECEASGSKGPGTFPMLPFARDFAKFTICGLLPLVNMRPMTAVSPKQSLMSGAASIGPSTGWAVLSGVPLIRRDILQLFNTIYL